MKVVRVFRFYERELLWRKLLDNKIHVDKPIGQVYCARVLNGWPGVLPRDPRKLTPADSQMEVSPMLRHAWPLPKPLLMFAAAVVLLFAAPAETSLA